MSNRKQEGRSWRKFFSREFPFHSRDFVPEIHLCDSIQYIYLFHDNMFVFCWRIDNMITTWVRLGYILIGIKSDELTLMIIQYFWWQNERVHIIICVDMRIDKHITVRMKLQNIHYLWFSSDWGWVLYFLNETSNTSGIAHREGFN